MVPPFYILGSQTQRPHSRKTIFTDGAPDQTFRPGLDIDLSHCRPNTTPAEYKADTSVEICFKFLAENNVEDWDLAIVDHLDTDGILSVFTLVYPAFAQEHQELLIAAAHMGDFWNWGDTACQTLYQGLTRYMLEQQRQETDIQEIYAGCFQKTQDLIAGNLTREDEEVIAQGQKQLAASLQKIESEEVERTVYHEHFVHYRIPRLTEQGDYARALTLPPFNGVIDDALWLAPHARNKYDRERVQLVSLEADGGCYYDLWYPGYMWAETPDSWNAPGLTFTGSRDQYDFSYPPLQSAIDRLNVHEGNTGQWEIAALLSPSVSVPGRKFPVVASFTKDVAPHTSSLNPHLVAQELAAAFY